MTMMRDHKIFEIEVDFDQEIRESVPFTGETRKVGERRRQVTLWVIAKNWETAKAYVLVDRQYGYKNAEIVGYTPHDISAVILQLPT